MCAIIGVFVALLSIVKSIFLIHARRKYYFLQEICLIPDETFDCDFWYNDDMLYTVEGISVFTSIILIFGIITYKRYAFLPWMTWTIVSMFCTLTFSVSIFIKLYNRINRGKFTDLVITAASKLLNGKEKEKYEEQFIPAACAIVVVYIVCLVLVDTARSASQKSYQNRDVRSDRPYSYPVMQA